MQGKVLKTSLPVLLLILASSVSAGEVRLKDGRTFEGKVWEWGDAVLLLRSGEALWVRAEDVAGTRKGQGDGDGFLVVEKMSPLKSGVGRAQARAFPEIDAWARHLAKNYAKAKEEDRKPLLESAVRGADIGLSALAQLVHPSAGEPESVRLGAVELLGKGFGKSSEHLLAEAVLEDRSARVRERATQAIRECVGRTPEPLLCALSGDDAQQIQRAAHAVELIRDRAGVGGVISALVAKTSVLSSGETASSYLMVMTDRTYIKDVSTLVGTTSGGSLDPELGTIREGTVFQVKVTGIQTLHTTLYRISGNHFKSREAILAWWEEHKGEF